MEADTDLSQDRELLQEFLIETSDNLGQLDRDMVELEQAPEHPALLNRIFRTIHTIKGTCGFLGLGTMERISHVGENVLNRLRNGELKLTPALATLILDTVDALRREAASLDERGVETGEAYDALVARLEAAEKTPDGAPVQVPVTPAAPPAPVAETLTALAATQQQSVNEESKPEARQDSKAADTTIRIDVGLADRLVNLVGELVLVRNQMLESPESRDATARSQMRHRLNLITTELQESVMKTRMQPVGAVWNKLPRIVRDLGAQLGKQIKLVMEGAETEMDRSIIEAIRDPLTHIVRNSCDHGIEGPELRRKRGKPEQGTLRMRAYHESGQVVIEIADDGGGIDAGRVGAKALEKGLVTAQRLEAMTEREIQDLIFLPGFSTAEKVSNVSGRGVGMDVVRNNIQSIGGAFDLASRFEHGTTLRIRIPLTLAIIPGLLVSAGGERFVIPQASLLDLTRLEGDDIGRALGWVDDNPVFRRDGKLWPLVFLGEALGLGGRDRTGQKEITIVFVQTEGRRLGLVVDAIHSTREIVVKPLGRMAKRLGVYAGATILDDGSVALIADVAGLARKGGLQETTAPAAAEETAEETVEGQMEGQKTFLLLEAGDFKNVAIPLDRVGRLEKFSRDQVEMAAGRTVIRYRGGILPLVRLSTVLSGFGDALPDAAEIATVVVQPGSAATAAGLMVDRIRDIRSARVDASRPANHPGLACSAIFDGRVCDVVDLDQIFVTESLIYGGEGSCS